MILHYDYIYLYSHFPPLYDYYSDCDAYAATLHLHSFASLNIHPIPDILGCKHTVHFIRNLI
jgi:hypothetical protein